MFSDYHTIIVIAVFTALLSLFLEFCFRPGNIFQGWLKFWADRWLKKKELYDKEMSLDDRYELVDWWYFKPLGYCVVCMNVWIIAIVSIPVEIGAMDLLFAILLSNFLVRYFKDRIL